MEKKKKRTLEDVEAEERVTYRSLEKIEEKQLDLARFEESLLSHCLLYTSDAADERG